MCLAADIASTCASSLRVTSSACCAVLQAHSQNDISDIYRFPLVTKGIFVNPALQEPFGLTVIEVRWPSSG